MDFIKQDEELEEDMKDEIDSMKGLLDQMKEERQEELVSSQTERYSRLERLKRSRQRDGRTYEVTTETQVESRTRVDGKPVEVQLRLDDDDNDTQRGGQHKRKQDTVVAELREKAEIISKSARKGPDDIAATLSRAQNIEDDPESAEYLAKIRGTSTTLEKKKEEESRQLEKNTVFVDFPSSPRKTSVTVTLNLDVQKSKIAVPKPAGRRKPTSDHVRRSLLLSDEEEPEDALAKFDADLDDDMDADDEDEPATPVERITSVEADVSEAMCATEAMIMPQSPVEYGQRITLERRGSFEGLIPRSSPKPRKPAWKSKTYGGVALPAFAEAMKAGSKSLKKTDTAERLLTADIVKQAAIDKLNRAAKEEMPEKEPEKPAWLVEAEARRKLHDRRRQNNVEKVKPETENPAIPIRLKKTGSKLLEEEIEKANRQIQSDEEDDSNNNKVVFKLKPTSLPGDKQPFEPEPAKISFKLKPTGIQLVKPAEPEEPEGPIKATIVQESESEPHVPPVRLRHIVPKRAPEPTNQDQETSAPVRLRHISPRPEPVSQTEETHGPSVRLRHISPMPVPEPQPEPKKELPSAYTRHITPRPVPGTSVEDQAIPPPSVRLRHISPKPLSKDFDSPSEPEITAKLSQRVKAQPMIPDEEDYKGYVPRERPLKPILPQTYEIPSYTTPKNQAYEPPKYQPPTYESPVRVVAQSPVSEPPVRMVPQGPRSPSPTRASHTPRSYDAPRPIRIVASTDYKERKPLEIAKIINQPTMNTTENSPSVSQSRTTPKHYCKVTPISNEPTQSSSRGQPLRVYELPATPMSYSQPPRTFSPSMTPSSKVTVVSHKEPPLSVTERSVIPAKSSRGRRISSERSKTVVVSGSEVQRIIPGRRTSSSEDPKLRHPVRRTSSLEYPRSHVERAADTHLKHAVTVVKHSTPPNKAKTLRADPSYSPRYAASEEVLPVWQQGMGDRTRKSSAASSGYDVSTLSWSASVLANKENEPRIVTQREPFWMREMPMRKRNSFTYSEGDIQNERLEALERLETRSAKTADSDDEVREVPGFMKEFQRKRMIKTRGYPIQPGYSPNSSSFA